MERRIKLKSMKRIGSHRLLREPIGLELEKPRPCVLKSESNVSFTTRVHKPSDDSTNTTFTSDDNDTSKGGGGGGGECYLIRAVNSVDIYEEDRTGIAQNVAFSAPTSNKDNSPPLETLIKNVVNTIDSDKYKMIDYPSSEYLNTNSSNVIGENVQVDNNECDPPIVNSKESNSSLNNGDNKCSGYASDSEGLSDEDSDSFDSEGVTLHLVNDSRNNNDNRIKIKNDYNDDDSCNRRNARVKVEGKSPTNISSLVTPSTPKIPLIKSNSLKVNSSKKMSDASNMETATESDEKTDRRYSVDENSRIADGFVNEVSQCLESNLSSSLLGRIDENGTCNTTDGKNGRESPEIPHFTVNYGKQYRSEFRTYSPQIPKASITNRTCKIRHSKSDVHICNLYDNRSQGITNNGAKTLTCRENQFNTSDSAIRRTKSKHEGQIFGFKIDGFGVRKLSQLKRRGKNSPVSHGLTDKDDANLSGNESCGGGSDGNDRVDGAKSSTNKRSSRLDKNCLLSNGNASCVDLSHLSVVGIHNHNVSDDSRSDCTSVYSEKCTSPKLTILGSSSVTNVDATGTGMVGGALRKCVQLLRSRSAVSQRDRPFRTPPPPPPPALNHSSRIIGPGETAISGRHFRIY